MASLVVLGMSGCGMGEEPRARPPSTASSSVTSPAATSPAVTSPSVTSPSLASPSAVPPSATPSGIRSRPSGPSGDRAEYVEGETVTRAPAPPGGGEALVSAHSRSGNAVLPLGGIGTGELAVQVNCRGKGTLTVTVEPIGLGFPLECGDHGTSSAYNKIHLKRERAEGSIRIAAPSAVRWAVTVAQAAQ